MRKDLQYIVGDHRKSVRRSSHKTRKWSPPRRHGLEDDGSPVRVPMRPRTKQMDAVKKRHEEYPDISEKPLLRSLRSCVGKPWAQTYGKLRRTFRRPGRTAIVVMSYVDRMTKDHEHLRSESPSEMRVNPTTGILEANPLMIPA